MKKFLSSLLALTMILSLVIVPARATNGYSVTGDVFSITGTGVMDNAVTLTKGTDSSKNSIQLSVSANSLGLQKDPVGEAEASTISGATASYKWTITGDAVTADKTNEANITLTAAKKSSAPVRVSCTITMTGKDGETDVSASKTSTNTIAVTVTDPQGDFAAAIESIGFGGKNYPVSNGKVSVPKHNENEFASGTWSVNFKQGTGYNATASFNNNVLTITGSNGESAQITVTPVPVTVVLSAPTYPVISKDGTTQITATYNGTESNVTYAWYRDNNLIAGQTTKTLTWTPTSETAAGNHSFKCVVSYGPADEDNVVESATKNVTVENATYSLHPSKEITIYLAKGATDDSLKKILLYPDKTGGRPVDDAAYTFSPSNTTKVSVSKDGTLTALAGGEVTITVTAKDKNNSGATQYKGKIYTKQVKVVVSALDYTLDDVESGSKAQDYTLSTLKEYAEKVIADSLNLSASAVTVNTLTAKSPAVSTIGKFEMTSRYLTFTPPTKAIGKAQIVMTATTSALGSFDITFIIPVTPIKTTYESQYPQPSGTSSNYKYSVDVPDGYKEYYVVAKNPSKAPTDYSEKLSGTKSSYSGNSLYPLSGSDFDKSGKCELYVVTYDKDGTAYCGVISVYQKSYDIKYSVVAGKSVSFSQKDFESFLEDIADDAGVYNSRKDTLELSYVKFSLPNSTREGVLYEGKSKIDRNDKVEDLDKVTFESVAKAKDTITISFTAYGKLYKDGASRGKDVDYSGNVVISVVKEDITYTVGIDDTVQLTARDFVNFLQDAKTSYRKAELDYVKFDVSGKNVSSYAYGGLYRSYSSYSTGKLADSTDKFYYEPSRTQYDLADVAYHTTRWAEAGKTVYIPFTVYGTKSGEEASGTMAITIAQTMNFIDVKASDFFYEPVKWAVNNKITNGTSSTTFSPYKNCNRAEIVTFLWRAAGSPEPTSTRNPFTDVNSVRDASYYKAILWASQKGITAGTNATTFSPYQECTRSQIVTFLYRYAGKPSGYYSNPFKDVSSVNEASYYNAILWAVGKGITQGTSTTTFSPYASCTRGEAVTFLYRYVNGVK